MAFNTSSWSVKEDANKAKLKLEIPNFSEVLGNTRKDQEIRSKQVAVGGSKFALSVCPKGWDGMGWKGYKKAEEGMLSAFLENESDHDVVVDYTISVEGGNSFSAQNTKILKEAGRGKWNLMRASEVGKDLNITVDFALKWEEISGGGMVEQNQANSSDLVEVVKSLGEKQEQMGEKLKQMGEKLEENMKNFVRAEIAKVRASTIPECPVCLLQLKPPKKIVQCLKVGLMSVFFIFL